MEIKVCRSQPLFDPGMKIKVLRWQPRFDGNENQIPWLAMLI
jgi:hypothetical protein